MNLEVFTTDKYFDNLLNFSYRVVIATSDKNKAKEIMQCDSELYISRNSEDIDATMKEPHTVLTVYNIFPITYMKINPFYTNFYNGEKGRVFIEIIEWAQKCSIKGCNIPAKSTCIKYDIVSENSGKPEIYHICPSCAYDYFFKIIRVDFQRLINALSFKTYFENCILSDNKGSLLDTIFKGDE